MTRLLRGVVLVLSLLVVVYVSLGYVFGQTASDRGYRSLAVFSEVLDRIQEDYVDEPDLHLVTIGAVQGLLESLDPLSSYLSPQEYAEYKKTGEAPARGDVGLVVARRGNGAAGYGIVVLEVAPGSPADRAGIREGNLIESINGVSTQDMSVFQAIQLLRGEPGSRVKLAVVGSDGPKPRDVELTRQPIAAPALLTTRLEGEIAYLRVPDFHPGRAAQIREKLLEFSRQGAQKLILDLRGCAAGRVEEAIATARLFLSSGTIATLRGQTLAPETFAAEPAQVVWRAPMTVLISASTAGAAEVLAAAIAGNHRGDTVGQTTFGMASEQKLLPLTDGGALLLTVGIYYTPQDKPILTAGVAPTVPMPAGAQLAALEDEDQPSDPLPGQLPSPSDPVVKKAVEILRGLAQRAA